LFGLWICRARPIILAMNTRLVAHHTALQAAHAIRSRALASSTTIEWEELPSLAQGLRRADFGPSTTPAWNNTLPLGLWAPQPEVAPQPFREPLAGLHVREIPGDEVFLHFFGR
jgi:hypothetical protein